MNSQAYYLRQYQTHTRSYRRVRIEPSPMVRPVVLVGSALALVGAYFAQALAVFCVAVWGGL